MLMRRIWMLCLLPLATAGCSVYVDDFHYSPNPGYVQIASTQPSQPAVATASAAIVGVRYASDQESLPRCVEVRFRLDNTDGQVVTLDPNSMNLTAGMLVRFDPPIVRPPQPVTLQPGASVFLTAYFPFPAGHFYDNTDMSSLQLTWFTQINGQNVPQNIAFNHVYYYYYDDPYWGPYPYGGFYGGVVIVGHGGGRWR
ncbi:MAG: hypothetical protein ABSG31_12505 [Tepidisphaeraceae bacterium]|jgi:hypothetical protein